MYSRDDAGSFGVASAVSAAHGTRLLPCGADPQRADERMGRVVRDRDEDRESRLCGGAALRRLRVKRDEVERQHGPEVVEVGRAGVREGEGPGAWVAGA